MLWSLAIKSVRKEHHKTVLNVPLCFSGTNELINNDLSSIRKVTELCLPEAESIWVSLSVSKFVSKDSKLGEMRVRGNELPSHSLRHGVVDWSVFSILVLIEHVGVSVRKGSSLNILT